MTTQQPEPPEIIDVREAHRFDEPRLEAYLSEHIAGFQGPMTVRQFDRGMSNPTFIIVAGGKEYVVRKKPPGELLKSAHAVDREYRVMKALWESDVPVPEMFHMCEDTSVVGTEFFVMERLEGRVFTDHSTAGRDATERRAMYREVMRVVASLHAVDYEAVGLGDFGRPGTYVQRQYKRWTKQYVASQTEEIASFNKLMEWLPSQMPAAAETTIVHGDPGLHNMMFAPDGPRIVGLLDWEISTLGNPLSDVAYFASRFYSAEPEHAVTVGRNGVPTPPELVADYEEFSGRTVTDFPFYVVFNMYRTAAIVQGVYYRGVQGNAASSLAINSAGTARRVSDTAWEFVQNGLPD
ncbi:MAG: putative kinase, aminoglycoside phosphotransferase (APT) family [Chloroflexi bacterium]|nr:MAG: putative kinase, aminoglycoside phosphotransferase (APT) family [Chloroflexota bacterium]